MTMSIGLPSPSLVIAASATLPAICVLTTILRFWARRLNKVKLMLDDWLILPALVYNPFQSDWSKSDKCQLLLISMGATLITGILNSILLILGELMFFQAFIWRHSHSQSLRLIHQTPAIIKYLYRQRWTIPSLLSLPHINLEIQLQWVSQMMQVLHLGFVKLSFIFLFRRIFLVNKYSTFGIASLVTIIVIISWTLAFFLTFLFACRGSFSAWWVPLHTTCIATVLFEETFVISDFVMDLIIVMMPMPMVSFFSMLSNPSAPSYMPKLIYCSCRCGKWQWTIIAK